MNDPFEVRTIEDRLDDLAMAPYPAYINDVLRTTAAQRPRPRWLMTLRAGPAFFGQRSALLPAPMRLLLAAALVLLALAAAFVLAGGADRPVPSPFGVTRPGVVGYSRGGDLYAVNPDSGAITPLIVSPELESGLDFAPDGRRFVFIRMIDDEPWIMVAETSGQAARPVQDQPALGVLSGSWAPDSRSLAIVQELNGHARISILTIDGPGVITLNLGVEASWPSFRPPTGGQIVFRGVRDGVPDLYLVNTDGTGLTPLGLPSLALLGSEQDLLAPAFSPDGASIAYHTVDRATGGAPRHAVHVYDLATGTDRVLTRTTDADEGWALWSPNGRWIAVQRWQDGGLGRFAILPADGHDAGREYSFDTPVERGPWIGTWAPDGSRLLEFLDRETGLVMVDPESGTITRPGWDMDEPPVWQRVGG